MKRHSVFGLLGACLVGGIALAVIAVGCGSSSPAVGADAVAVVGNRQISKEKFQALIDQACKSYQSQHRPCPKPGTQEYTTFRKQAMAYLIQRSEFEQKADDLGIKVTDQDVTDKLNKIKAQYFGVKGKCDAACEAKYQKQLKTQGLTEGQVREDVRASVIQDKIFEKVTKGIVVTDKDVEDYYKKNKQQYVTPATRDVRHILVKKKGLADQIYQQLKNGGNFAALAKKYSQDPGTKNSGGKISVSKGHQVPEFDKTAFSLKTHAISKPVKTQYGYHIIQALTPIKKEKLTPLSQVKEAIRQQLIQQKRQEKMSSWVNGARDDFKGKTTYQVGYAPPPDTNATTTK